MTNPIRTTTPTARARPNIFAAFSSPNYLLYWVGSLISIVGWQIQWVAQSWLVYRLTDSPFYLGLVGLVTSLPTIALTLFAGVLADQTDRRRLLFFTQLASALLVFVLALLASSGLVTIWYILGLAFLSGIVAAFDTPARMALLPALIDQELLMNAIALTNTVWNVSTVVGSVAAGMLIAPIGEAGCFYLAAAGFVAMAFALSRIRLAEKKEQAVSANVLRNLAEGLTFIMRNSLFALLMGLTFSNSIFGMAYVYLMPVFARDILQVGIQGLGFLNGVSGLGATAGALIVASLGGFGNKGWLLLGGSTLFGLSILSFGLSLWYYLSLGLLGISGLAFAFYSTTASTVIQSQVPDALRGRVMSVYGLAWSLAPVGGMAAGATAAFAGAPLAVALSGALVTVFTVTAATLTSRVRRLR